MGLGPGIELELFRIVKTDVAGDLLDCFTSSFALDRPPRGWEQRSTVIHMGLSMFERPRQASATAHRYPQLGSYIARVHLAAQHGFGVARTGPPGHMTVWGRPLEFFHGVVEISSVDEHA